MSPEMKAALQELQQDIKAYVDKNVLPEMQGWKARLDGAMDSKDLTTLNELRAKAASMRAEGRKAGRDMRQAWKDEDYGSLKQTRDELKGMRDERKQLLEQLKPLGRKYASTLKEIGAAAKTKVATWREDGKAIAKSWLDKHQDLPQAKRALGMIRGLLQMRMFGGTQENADRQKMMAARFMLWDGTAVPGMFGDATGGGRPTGNGTASKTLFDATNYPNPFKTSTTVRYTLPKEESVQMRVLDNKGRQVATLVDGATMPKGPNTVVFESKELPSGTYFVEIVTPSGKQSIQTSIVK